MKKKVISIEYSLKDANTKEDLDSNVGGKPLEFISGTEQIIPGLEKELINLNTGDKIDVLVQPMDGYGEVNEDAIQTLPKEQFAGVELEVGMTLYGTGENGETVQVVVKSMTDEDVTIDYNHPMAGRTLMFTVQVLAIREATAEEIQTGVVGGLAAMEDCGCGDGGCSTPEPKHTHKEEGCCGEGHCS